MAGNRSRRLPAAIVLSLKPPGYPETGPWRALSLQSSVPEIATFWRTNRALNRIPTVLQQSWGGLLHRINVRYWVHNEQTIVGCG